MGLCHPREQRMGAHHLNYGVPQALGTTCTLHSNMHHLCYPMQCHWTEHDMPCRYSGTGKQDAAAAQQHTHRPPDCHTSCTNTKTVPSPSTLTTHCSPHSTITNTTNSNTQRVSQSGLLAGAWRPTLPNSEWDCPMAEEKKYKNDERRKRPGRPMHEQSSSQCQPRRCYP